MIYLLIFLVTTFFTAWLNAKFINDSSGRGQYWHIVQFYQQIWIWTAFGIIVVFNDGDIIKYIVDACLYGMMYMLIYNSALDAFRRMNLTHLGRYDILSFKGTVYLALAGLLGIILFNI